MMKNDELTENVSFLGRSSGDGRSPMFGEVRKEPRARLRKEATALATEVSHAIRTQR